MFRNGGEVGQKSDKYIKSLEKSKKAEKRKNPGGLDL